MIKSQTEIESVDEIEELMISQGKMKPARSKSNHYVNNKDCLEAYKKYRKIKLLHDERDLPAPPLPEIIGKAILQIAKRRCNSWRVTRMASESWKEEFISNAIVTAAIRGVGFDPEKSDNPFAYLTSIINNALLEQLRKERKQLYIKYKRMDEVEEFSAMTDENVDETNFSNQDLTNDVTVARKQFIKTFEENNFTKKDKEEEETDSALLFE